MSLPIINVALEDHQEDYWPTMIELEGELFNQTVSILIDTGASLSYVSINIVEKCHLQEHKFKNA